jgi:hypothetical protein
MAINFSLSVRAELVEACPERLQGSRRGLYFYIHELK